MKKIVALMFCLCFAWLIHFEGGAVLKVDKIQPKMSEHFETRSVQDTDHYGRRAYFIAEKDGKPVVVPWFRVLYTEEVE